MLNPSYSTPPARNLLDNWPVTVTTSQQRPVTVRQGVAADSAMLAQMYRRLSERTIRLRYGAPQGRF